MDLGFGWFPAFAPDGAELTAATAGHQRLNGLDATRARLLSAIQELVFV